MREVEEKARALLLAYCNTDRYTAKAPLVEVGVILMQALLILLCGFAMWCTVEFRGSLGAWALLWFCQMYLEYFTFMTMHEWRHASLSSTWMGHVYYVVGWLSSLMTSGEIFSYYLMGHLEHHKNTGHTCILEYVRKPWWQGKDADVLFFPFSGKSPFKQLSLPATPFMGLPVYLFFGGFGFPGLMTVLTLGSMVMFGISKDACSVLALQAVRLFFMFHSGPEGWWYPFPNVTYWLIFTALTIHVSLVSFYVPLTHPERKSERPGLKLDLERRYSTDYPSFTPEFPAWVHKFVFLGLTYHIEHHCFPLTPWYNLALVHEDLVKIAGDQCAYPQPGLKSMDQAAEMPKCVVRPSELSQHCTPEALWVAVDGVVLDLTEWYPRHPGGAQLLIERAGTEIGAEYLAQHGDLRNIMASLTSGIAIVGRLGAEDPEAANTTANLGLHWRHAKQQGAEEPLLGHGELEDELEDGIRN